MSAKTSFVYELRSVNLATLPPNEQATVLDRFTSFLESLSDPISFWVVEDEREVNALGSSYKLRYKRFFIESASQIDSLISNLRTKMVRVLSVPKLSMMYDGPSYVVDKESQFVQTYNVTKLGGTMYPGFLNELYPITHAVRIEIEPMDPVSAKDVSRKYALSVGSKIILRRSEGRSIDPDDQVKYDRAEGASQLIARGLERLFRVRLNMIMVRKLHEDLVQARRKLKQTASSLGLQIDSPKYLQRPLLTGRGPDWATGRRFYVTTSTAASFFPFAGLDIIDPAGVFLGQNLLTGGNAIIYDLFDKESYDISIMGTKGYGKSTFVKTFLTRMLLADREMMVFVLDSIVKPEYGVGPDGKFESSFAALNGCVVHRFEQEKGAGLDPFAVFPTKSDAAKFLSSVIKVEDEPGLETDLKLAAKESSSVDELIANSSGELKKRLDANLPPYMFLFKGEMELYPRMVFVLYDIPSNEIRDAAAFLTISAIWKKIPELPVRTRKALVVDEGWALVETNPRTGKSFFPMAVEYVPEIVSTCRHYNTSFVLATQLVSDLMGRGGVYGPGRRVIESCGTKVILKQDQAASEILANEFRLSEREQRFVTNAKAGQGLLLTQEGHVNFYNFLSEMEAKLFTTRPKDITG